MGKADGTYSSCIFDEAAGVEVEWAKTAMILCGGPAGQGADFTEWAD